MIKLWRFLSVPIVLAVCLGLLLVPVAVPGQGQVALASGNVTVAIEPATTQVLPSGSFTLDTVISNPDGVEVFINMIELDFDPTYFTVDSVSAVDLTFAMSPPVIDNVTGTIAWQPSMSVGTSTNLTTIISARISCTAKSLEGVSTVSWVYESGPPPRTTTVEYGATDYLEGGNMSLMHSGTVIIGDVFNLTVTSDGCCPIDVSGAVSGTVAAGSTKPFVVPVGSVTLNADASDVCCDFVNWTVNGTFRAGNSIVVTGAANTSHTANATCSEPQYNLTMEVSGNGTTTPASGTTSAYDCGHEVDITATANASWRFVNWTTTGDITKIDNATANSTTVTMDENKTVTANFVERFTLTMNVTNNGTTDPVVGNHTYDNGTVVDITAIPDACWDFVNWTGNVTSNTSASTNITMSYNETVIANFAQVNYTLNITVTGSGNVTINNTITPTSYPNSTSYINCTVVNLTATPDADWAFVNWTGDVADPNSTSTNITVDADKTVTANFGPHDFSASPRSLTFTTVEGENPPSQTLEICNIGNGTLNWTLSDKADWLSEAPPSGSLDEGKCEDVTVSVDVAGMEAGDYTATITITGSTWMEVPVSLHIESAMWEIPGAPAGLSASALSISPQQVEPGQEVTISINVANSGGETGSYNAILYINEVVEASQSVSVAAGTSKNVIFTVSKSQAGVYDVSLAGQSGQFEVVSTGWFAGGLGTGGIVAIVVVVIILIVAVVFILRGTRREI